MPVCSKCHAEKSVDEFTKNKSHRAGHNPACKDCDAPTRYRREFEERGGPLTEDKRCGKCHLTKEYTAFGINKQNKDGLSAYCDSCQRSGSKQRYYLTSDREHRDPVHIRFWKNVDCTGGADACWIWQGLTDEYGYGLSKNANKGKVTRAHRLAWELTFGDIPAGRYLLHSCNRPGCVNVFRHLRLGTQAENMQQCGAEGRMPGMKKANNPPQKRAKQVRYSLRKKDIPWEEVFWSRIDKSGGQKACWLWTGGLTNGYGAFSYDGKVGKAHVIAYQLTHGDFFPGLHLMHRCDQRACCNPSHLFPGTREENFMDMVHKNRHAHSLTPDQVRYARSMRGTLAADKIALELGVTRSAISSIWNNRTWKHLK
jgi:hypothetical protein